VLRLHGAPGGPTSITGTARLALAIFYIVITQLSGHTQGEVVSCRRRSASRGDFRQFDDAVLPPS